MHHVILLSPTPALRARTQVARIADRVSLRVECAMRGTECLPPWCWPLLVALAAWPSAWWSAHRLLDDSDDPLGIVALGALMLMLWHARPRFDHPPRIAPLAIAASLVGLSNLPIDAIPSLLRACMASIGIVVALAAIADRDEPIAPYVGLSVLALPLLSSLQFYAGFPLRVITAEATRWLLRVMGSTVERIGSALTVDGHLVLVDAPCSGVRMAWVGYFTACVVAWMFRLSNRAFVARLPLIGLTVMAGNIVRNTVLVAAEAGDVRMTDAMHAAIGLAAFALVAATIGVLFARGRRPKAPVDSPPSPRFVATSGASRLAVTASLVVVASMPLAAPAALQPSLPAPAEWPTTWDDIPLRPLALSPVELRFAAHFPGTIGRFAVRSAAGDRSLVLRDVREPTRRLHPAVDCYRGLGFTIAGERLEHDGDARLWRCFVATRGGTGLRVCERIVDADGRAFTDVSSWYWAASLSQSRGPWRAVTVATSSEGAS